MKQEFSRYYELLDVGNLDQLFEELSQNHLPLPVLYENGTVSSFISTVYKPVAVKWNGLYLYVDSMLCSWLEASAFCHKHIIKFKPCRLMSDRELEKFDPEDLSVLNQTLNKLKLPQIEGSLWGDRASFDLAYFKYMDVSASLQASYIANNNRHLAIPVISESELN